MPSLLLQLILHTTVTCCRSRRHSPTALLAVAEIPSLPLPSLSLSLPPLSLCNSLSIEPRVSISSSVFLSVSQSVRAAPSLCLSHSSVTRTIQGLLSVLDSTRSGTAPGFSRAERRRDAAAHRMMVGGGAGGGGRVWMRTCPMGLRWQTPRHKCKGQSGGPDSMKAL
jgi:hypothetical protein